ncbi:MAG TPA: hypothetical protein VLE95_01690 [Chlamydiales bacterium]|nr:hypothetical protein [Chlamydiales bacterium]
MNCNIWFHRRISHLAAVAIAVTLAMLCVPRDGCCEDEKIENMAKDILAKMKTGNFESIPEKFEELGQSFELVDDPVAAGRKFFKVFINEVNAQYGLSLTVSQACELIRDKSLQLSPEYQERLSQTIELLGAEDSVSEMTPKELQRGRQSRS